MQRVYQDPNGRFAFKHKHITLVTICAPNNDDPTFIKGFFEHLLDFKREEIIIGGDFNLVFELDKDKQGGVAKTHNKSAKVVQEFMDNLDLIDAWRVSRHLKIYLAPQKTRNPMPTRFLSR